MIEFAKAFLAAQQEMPSIAKSKTAEIPTQSGSYSYTYADLGDLMDTVLPILHKNGISVSQPPVSQDGLVGVKTILYHTSGHVEDMGTLLLSAGSTPQGAGSALTYARRYALSSALGVVADEDTDGQQPTELDELVKAALAQFERWTPEERWESWVANANKLFGGKPATPEEIAQVAESVAADYAEMDQ